MSEGEVTRRVTRTNSASTQTVKERQIDRPEKRRRFEGVGERLEGKGYTSIRLKSATCRWVARGKGAVRDWEGDPRTFRSAGGKSKHVGESVLVYCTRRPSPLATYKFNGGRERRKRKRVYLSQSRYAVRSNLFIRRLLPTEFKILLRESFYECRNTINFFFYLTYINVRFQPYFPLLFFIQINTRSQQSS